MSLQLTKKGGLNLTKVKPSVTVYAIELSWNTNTDPDLSGFELNNTSGSPVLIGEEGVCFYGQPNTTDGALTHSGDSRKAGTETILVDVSKARADVNEISFVVTLAGATDPTSSNYGQTFVANVQDAVVRIFDADSGTEFAHFALDNTTIDPQSTAVHFGSLLRAGTEWSFEAVGDGLVGFDLEKLIHFYNPNIATEGHG